MVELGEKEGHEGIVEDAEEKREKLLLAIEKKKNEKTKFDQDYKGISLKHKLDITLNPMYHNLKNVLDDDFANTSDYDSHMVEMEDLDLSSQKGMMKLK